MAVEGRFTTVTYAQAYTNTMAFAHANAERRPSYGITQSLQREGHEGHL